MVALRSVVAACVAAAAVAICAAGDGAKASGPDDHSFLLFTGTDIWRCGDFLYGGFLWSPKGLDNGGFTFKMLLDGGAYNYVSGMQQTIDGTKLSAAALPGWRFTRGGLNVSVFAGPVVQDYRLTPNDPGSHLHGLYAGGEAAVDIWYQPSAMTMAAFNGAIASIGPTGYVRGAIGVRVLNAGFIGPEIEQIWCGDFEEIEFGAHLTGLRFNSVEWSMASGFALTSDQRSGPYWRLGVNTRY